MLYYVPSLWTVKIFIISFNDENWNWSYLGNHCLHSFWFDKCTDVSVKIFVCTELTMSICVSNEMNRQGYLNFVYIENTFVCVCVFFITHFFSCVCWSMFCFKVFQRQYLIVTWIVACLNLQILKCYTVFWSPWGYLFF